MSPDLPGMPADVVAELGRAPAGRLRRIADEVASVAVAMAAIEDDRVRAAGDAIREGRFGDSSERTELRALVEELDMAAWELQRDVGAGDAEDEEYAAAFRRARAVNALWCALDADPATAARDAVYEASHAVGESRVRAVLTSLE
jgi:hypothetical protein